MAKKRKRARKGGWRRRYNAHLSLRHINEAIGEMEGRYRAYKPTPRQRKHRDRTLRFLAVIKKRIRVFCLAAGDDDGNMINSLAHPE